VLCAHRAWRPSANEKGGVTRGVLGQGKSKNGILVIAVETTPNVNVRFHEWIGIVDQNAECIRHGWPVLAGCMKWEMQHG